MTLDDSKIIATPVAQKRRNETGSGDNGDDNSVCQQLPTHENEDEQEQEQDDSHNFVTPSPRPRVPGFAYSRVWLDKHPHRDEIESLLELSSTSKKNGDNNTSTPKAIFEQSPKKPPGGGSKNITSSSSGGSGSSSSMGRTRTGVSSQLQATMQEQESSLINYSTPLSKAKLPFARSAASSSSSTTTAAAASPTAVETTDYASEQSQNEMMMQDVMDDGASTKTTNNEDGTPNSHSHRTTTIIHRTDNSNSNNPKQHYLQTIATLQQIRDQLQQETAKAKLELACAKQQLQHAPMNLSSSSSPPGEQQEKQPTFDSPNDLEEVDRDGREHQMKE
ncbi:unnamed protein product [Cylindrotheca closterium]|uniref:Uncharacterized protein n=1 Tax=Cylindrotheca closterium TaxID=2856 RepID=A0AAD2FMT8_9STRA|nr:unnamed protein product [Cylindrotheca closterium]